MPEAAEQSPSEDPIAVVVLDPSLARDGAFRRLVAAAADMASRRYSIEAELRRSRRRAILAADVERQRIERNLHDGAQQQLLAARVKLGTIQQRLEPEDPDTARLLAEVDADLDEATEGLRQLAGMIHPHLLDDLGLAGALKSAGRRAPGPVTVVTDGIGRYSAEIETAVHYCCLEALQNAVKHAGPTVPVSIRVWQEGMDLRFEVGDRGPGFDPEAGSEGIGLSNMQDRIGALGGAVVIESRPGAGTKVSGAVSIVEPSG